MTTEEVNAIFSLVDINKDGKLDYSEVSLVWSDFYSYWSWCHFAVYTTLVMLSYVSKPEGDKNTLSYVSFIQSFLNTDKSAMQSDTKKSLFSVICLPPSKI